MVRAESLTATQVYTYNGNGLLVAQSLDGVETSFTWDQALEIPQVLATSDGLASLYGLGRLAVEQAGAWYYPQGDGLGSVRQWTDALPAVLATQSYSPYGEPLSGLEVAPWGFTGEWHDPSGLVYLRARWYKAAWGRFAQVDPWPGGLARPATRHPYAFAFSNPQRYTDPTGRDADSGLTPEEEFAEWYRSTHDGRDPSSNKIAMFRAAFGHRGIGMRGEWTVEGWSAYEELIGLLGPLLYQFNECTASEDFHLATAHRYFLELLYISYACGASLPPGYEILPGPGGTKVIINGFIPPGGLAWALGNVVTLPRTTWVDESERRFWLIHEYAHVLQWRGEGIAMERRYLDQQSNPQGNPYEKRAEEIERHYRAHPELPDPWNLAAVEWR